MLNEQIDLLEKRATKAEAALEALEGGKVRSGDDHVRERLLSLQKLIEEDRKEAQEVDAQRTALLEENDLLKGKVTRLEYRVQILLRSLKEQDDKIAALEKK